MAVKVNKSTTLAELGKIIASSGPKRKGKGKPNGSGKPGGAAGARDTGRGDDDESGDDDGDEDGPLFIWDDGDDD